MILQHWLVGGAFFGGGSEHALAPLAKYAFPRSSKASLDLSISTHPGERPIEAFYFLASSTYDWWERKVVANRPHRKRTHHGATFVVRGRHFCQNRRMRRACGWAGGDPTSVSGLALWKATETASCGPSKQCRAARRGPGLIGGCAGSVDAGLAGGK